MFDSYDPMKLIKQIHNNANEDLNATIEENKQLNNTGIVKPKKKNKLIHKILLFLGIIMVVFCVTAFFIYREICALPYERHDNMGDTPVSVSATYNAKYHIAKIDLNIDEVIEKWQVTFSDGHINEIKLICETNDKTVKREFKFINIPLIQRETIKTSLTLDDVSLHDFVLIKELLSGNVNMTYPPIINLDSSEREKLKQYYESGAWFWGLMWANSLMGGY